MVEYITPGNMALVNLVLNDNPEIARELGLAINVYADASQAWAIDFSKRFGDRDRGADRNVPSDTVAPPPSKDEGANEPFAVAPGEAKDQEVASNLSNAEIRKRAAERAGRVLDAMSVKRFKSVGEIAAIAKCSVDQVKRVIQPLIGSAVISNDGVSRNRKYRLSVKGS